MGGLLGSIGSAAFIAALAIASQSRAQEAANGASIAQSAQDASSDPQSEIIVTATRGNAASIQDVPIAVSALNPDFLSTRGQGGLQDISRTLPSINVQETAPGLNRIDMRGLTTGTTATSNIQDRPLVAVYLDDIPISVQNSNPDLRVFDLERVEVIRGPQGTLYGAGSMSGTIRYITKKPTTDEVSGSVEGVGSITRSGGENYSVRAIANLPVSETIAIRLGAYQGHNSGFIDNLALDRKDVNDDRTTQLRAAVRWQPTDALTIDGSVTFAEQTADGFNRGYPALGRYVYSQLSSDRYYDNLKIYNLSGEYDFGPVKLVSSSSYLDRKNEQVTSTDDVGGLFGLGNIPAKAIVQNRFKDFTQETRLVSDNAGVFTWTLGAFYQKAKRKYLQNYPSPGFDAAFSGVIGAPFSSLDYLAFSTDNIFSGLQDIDERQVAAFGEGTLHLGPVDLTGGLRYFNHKQSFSLLFAGIAGAQGVGQPLTFDGVAKANGFNPRGVLSLKASDDLLIYAEAARGFRYGGVNQPVPVSLCGSALAQVGRTEAPGEFGPDKLWSYAIGEKATLLDKRMTFNVAAFYVDWKDVQTTRNLSCGYRFTENEGRVRSVGVEVESRVRVSSALTFYANGSITRAEANGDIPTIGAQDGDRVPYFPSYTAAAGVELALPVETGEFLVTADFQARGSSHTEFSPLSPARRRIPASEIVNLAAKYTLSSWEFGVFGTNIFNSQNISFVMAGDALIQDESVLYGRPRTLGVRVKRSF
ncbi:TonB-dependent receptor plug domain-containing protein [Sphingobium sp.]|uniref:TonB-dependent receptor n=1 Tax=Sphingobium sp. TaxID=1912891 RepID=UPI0028BD934C|nr:TonB-dependent receptor plug domain-containing protein [Sphingobium sp.]